MKILITGGAGFIGSALVRAALKAGHIVINVDKLTYAAAPTSLQSIEGDSNYRFERADICDRPRMDEIFNSHHPDAVMHLAAESHVDRSIDGPSDFIETNIVGTFTLLESARAYFEKLPADRKARFRYHHISTDEVYGDLSRDEPAFDENSPYKPSSPYAASKASSDHLTRAWNRTYNLPVVISNCSNNYGPRQFPEKLIPLTILKILHGQTIPVYGRGDNIRDWLFVEDHAEALMKVLQSGRTGETYNIGGNSEQTNLQIVEMICDYMDEKLKTVTPSRALITFVEDRPGHDFRYAINGDKISKELGWQPKLNIHDGLRLTVDWYLDNDAWWKPLVKSKAFGQRLGTSTF